MVFSIILFAILAFATVWILSGKAKPLYYRMRGIPGSYHYRTARA